MGEQRGIRGFEVPVVVTSARPGLASLLLAASDAAALTVAWWLAVQGRLLAGGVLSPELYWRLWPGTVLLVLANGLQGLYPGFGTNAVEELRRTSASVSLVHLVAGAATFVVRGAEVYSRAVFLVAWLLALVLVPVGRAAVRHVFCRSRWWGYPVLILGAGRTGELLAKALQEAPGLGLRPVAFLDDDPAKPARVAGLPVLGGVDLAPRVAREVGISHALVAMPGAGRERLLQVVDRYASVFPHLLVVPDLFGLSSLWVAARDLQGVVALEVRQQLLLRGPRLLKRTLDLAATVVLGLLSLPLIALVAAAVRLDSPGPVFFAQTRIGKGGRKFRAWKFRTMVRDADQLLERFLQDHPALRAEWERDQKLRDDPRVTRVGRLLRRTSLDELPQLWNVLRGEMSLVGPRPIVDEEVGRYGPRFTLYAQVLPGITGLWQVSGRNDTTYEQRVELDSYYVRNWSPWLDLYILARTVWVVLTGRGAY
ncbi:MAG: undecaprenyl-phosphate galactose phosphotransferase WbaP [Armatimonadota bacterium]|nr:undecaprenyl-phosphate galactose phosphotransferase WbaP [Armatimonadota bacterium]